MKRIDLEVFRVEAFAEFTGEETVFTPTHVYFWKPPGPFGQWTPSPFEVDGERYECAEQFMMAEKARLFGDLEIAASIRATTDPRAQKKLGKQVRGFQLEEWEKHRLEIVVKGNMAKFGQSPSLLALLLETGSRVLVEASPLDCIWGIGLAANQPEAHDPAQWRGLNLLGKALMIVRSHLAVSTTPDR